MTLILLMLVALAATVILELLFALIWGVRKRGLLIVVLMNMMTNPAVNWLYSLAVIRFAIPRVPCVILLELCVFAVEGLCCKGVIRKPWLFSLLVNLFSYGVGLIISLMV